MCFVTKATPPVVLMVDVVQETGRQVSSTTPKVHNTVDSWVGTRTHVHTHADTLRVKVSTMQASGWHTPDLISNLYVHVKAREVMEQRVVNVFPLLH